MAVRDKPEVLKAVDSGVLTHRKLMEMYGCPDGEDSLAVGGTGTISLLDNAGKGKVVGLKNATTQRMNLSHTRPPEPSTAAAFSLQILLECGWDLFSEFPAI